MYVYTQKSAAISAPLNCRLAEDGTSRNDIWLKVSIKFPYVFRSKPSAVRKSALRNVVYIGYVVKVFVIIHLHGSKLLGRIQ